MSTRTCPPASDVKVLQGAGLPAPVAEMLASADEGIAPGDLDDSSGDSRRLISGPTTPLSQAVAAAFKR